MFESLKGKLKSRKAYAAHVMGNNELDKANPEKAREKHEEALKLYAEAYDAGVRDPQILMAYAVLLMRFDDCEKARNLLLECEKAPDLDAKSRKQLRENYSVCMWKLGNLDRATELMESAASSGKTSRIYTTLGCYYIEKGRATGDFSKAVEFNAEALEYDDEDAGILDNLGQQHYFMGEPDKAYEYFSKAYAAKPNQAATLYYIAKINLERKNYEKAEAFIDKCIAEGNFSALATVTKAQAQELKNEIIRAKG